MNKEFAAKKAELTKRGLAALSVLAFAILACIGGGGDSNASKTAAALTEGAHTTETFGAEEWHKQLTAIQEEANVTQKAYDATAAYGEKEFEKQLTAIAGTQQAKTTPTP